MDHGGFLQVNSRRILYKLGIEGAIMEGSCKSGLSFRCKIKDLLRKKKKKVNSSSLLCKLVIETRDHHGGFL